MNENEILFELKNVSCCYTGFENAVLRIGQLRIPRGKIIFLLGSSGSGKSTLLETLGLMNHTLSEGEIFFYPDAKEKNPIEYRSLWKKNNKGKISEIRKEYFSFVFQNTNLMENFTAYENVTLSDLIGSRRALSETLKDATDLMARVKLPPAVVSYNTHVSNLSGGQRQRLSFVRALAKKPKVLFCDEPTGNLDEANAAEIFETITRLKQEDFTSIIVSHDINLAIKYADQIFIITKNSRDKCGEILNENIFYRETWSAFSAEESRTFRNKIASFFKHTEETGAGKSAPAESSGFRLRSFNALFYLKEGKSLLGKNFVNFWILLLLLSISLLAIGFANGSLNYLDKKMHNAFVKWVPLKIPFTRATDKEFLPDFMSLDDERLKKQFGYSAVSVFANSYFEVKDDKQNALTTASSTKGRSIDVKKDSSFMTDFILEEKNFVRGDRKGFNGEKDLSVIVKEDFLKALNYPEHAEYIHAEFSFSDSTGKPETIFAPLPIRAVVKEIPGKNDLLFTTYFYSVKNQVDAGNVFNINKYLNRIQVYLSCDRRKAEDVKGMLGRSLADDAMMNKYGYRLNDYSIDIAQHEQSYGNGNDLIFIFFNSFPSVKGIVEVKDEINNLIKKNFPGINSSNSYDYSNVTERFDPITYDGISIYFNQLDSVRAFNRYILKNLNGKNSSGKIEMDESQIKEKDNFNFLSKVTLAVSYLIIIFGSLALSIFIFNLLKNHLQKVKMNIGTFKAMGLSNARTLRIYFMIITVFIFSGVILSFLLVSGLGEFINSFLKHFMNIESDVDYFKLTDEKTVVSMVIFSAVSLLVSWLTIRKILSKTPGDLIYNRS